MAKTYDPLWELAGEKVPLQGMGTDIDAHCPNCHVIVHLAQPARAGDGVECGLCGEPLTITEEGGVLSLAREE